MPAPKLAPEICQQTVDAVATHGSISAAARALGLPVATFRTRLEAAQRGNYQPQTQALIVGDAAAAGEGYKLKGTSTLYDKEGKVSMQWVKTNADVDALIEMQRASLRAMCEEIEPIKPITTPTAADTDLATLYTLTDCHVGMLAWSQETGEPWDLKIAERTLVDVFVRAIDAAPNSRVGIINQLGDFLHFDSLTPETPAHRHVLDADSRYQKVVEVAVRIIRRVITHALGKHAEVQVYLHEGNHDPAGSVWLRVMFAQLYADNPRVTIGQSPNPYVAYQHGQTLICFHHGHLARLNNLPIIFAEKFHKLWGKTQFRYVHVGHKHHVEEKEHPGIKVVQHPTLAAPDAYSSRGGWLSKRQATSITYHTELGEFSRQTFIPNTKKDPR